MPACQEPTDGARRAQSQDCAKERMENPYLSVMRTGRPGEGVSTGLSATPASRQLAAKVRCFKFILCITVSFPHS